MSTPKINTAIPKHRYQIGIFSVVILGEIDSDDSERYRYICAVVEEGQSEPILYISLIPGSDEDRLVISSMGQVQELQVTQELRDLEFFTDNVIPMVQKLLQLTDEIAAKLM